MTESLEIPNLDYSLYELIVCGHLKGRTVGLKRRLNELKGDNVARIGGKKSYRYLDVYGNGSTSHLHVEVLFRTLDWAASKTLQPLPELKRKVMEFANTPIESTVTGRFFVHSPNCPRAA